MTFTFTIGSWIFPVLFAAGVFAAASWLGRNDVDTSFGFAAPAIAIIKLLRLLAALVVALAGFVVWLLLK